MHGQIMALRPCTWVYLAMMAMTLLTWLVGVSGLNGLAVSLLVLALALIKGFLVGDYFMGLKWVRGGWRWLVASWLLLPGFMISVTFIYRG